MSALNQLILDGQSLTAEKLNKAAHNRTSFSITPEAREQMLVARSLVNDAVDKQIPVYGVTTGLGAKVTEVLDADALSDFSYQTIRGRAHAVGHPEDKAVVRAAMIVRLNTLLPGAAAASIAVADHLLACLNADLTPVAGQQASIGAGDLVWNATMAQALIGEGLMQDAAGNIDSAQNILQAAEISVPALGPKDGLLLSNNFSYSIGLSALALQAAHIALDATQAAAALTMEGFRANLLPFDEQVLALKPQPGQNEAVKQLLLLLAGSKLFEPGQARRLQDPLSIRNIAQIHGTVYAALDFANQAVNIELNSTCDNPVALIELQKLVSAGVLYSPHLTNVIETVSRSFVHLCVTQLARISKMLSPRFTDLPLFLAKPQSHSNGFAPLMKTAESLLAELLHEAQPVPIWPSINADGVEDSMTATPTAARALLKISEHSRYLSAIELLVAQRAVELRHVTDQLGDNMKKIYHQVKQLSLDNDDDHSLTADIELIANSIQQGEFTVVT